MKKGKAMATEETWGVYANSHWQGARPPSLIAVGTKDQAKNVADALSTCSFCTPGRVANYSTGSCYFAQRIGGYRKKKARRLPDGCEEWSRGDVADWWDDCRCDADE